MKAVQIDLPVPSGWQVKTYAENQPEYLPLPVLKSSAIAGDVLSRWHPSWRERLRLIFGADVFLNLWTFHHPLQPIHLFIGAPTFQESAE